MNTTLFFTILRIILVEIIQQKNLFVKEQEGEKTKNKSIYTLKLRRYYISILSELMQNGGTKEKEMSISMIIGP